MPNDKAVPMREAVALFVPDGASVRMGTALEALIPFAADCDARIDATCG